MTEPERWDRIQQLFDAVVEMKPAERRAFLMKECAGDDELYAEVLSLVEADESGHSLLDHSPLEVASPLGREYKEPQVIGRYRIVSELGRGGMGVVYLAEREGDDFSQKVALKIIRSELDSELILERFKSERRILAQLSHANIARLLDGGLTEEGLPYFTLEYVDGRPITTYCDKEKLSLRERLVLFLQVCRAVGHAQENLIVHRDLKPSNMLVTGEGNVKLLDFGIAKLVREDSLSDSEPDLTRTGVRVMTPGYAAPEQFKSEAVTTATDVYSLGVVLYELICGRRPYSMAGLSPAQMEIAVTTGEPLRPSKALTQGPDDVQSENDVNQSAEIIASNRGGRVDLLRRQLAGDLDNICLMALRKESARRYHSAQRLADEIERYLDGRPVIARGDSALYRTGKFVSRHRVIVSFAAVLLVVISAMTVFYTIRLATERDRAKSEADKATQVAQMLTDMFQLADPNQTQGEEVTARELLDRGAEQIQLDLAEQPELLSEMLVVVAGVYQQLGLLNQEAEKLDRVLSLLDSLDLRNSPVYADALFRRATLYTEQGQYSVADSVHLLAMKAAERIEGPNSQLMASNMTGLAANLRKQGRFEDAKHWYHEALKLQEQILGPDHLDVAHTLNHLGQIHLTENNLDQAEMVFRRSLSIRRSQLGERHVEVAASLGSLGRLMVSRRRLAEAENVYREALDIVSHLFGEDHHYVGGLSGSLASVLLRQGKLDEADSLFRKSREILLKTLPQDHLNQTFALLGMGSVLVEQGKWRESVPLLEEALTIRRAHLPEAHWQVASAMSALGHALAQSSDLNQAEELLVDGYDYLLESQGAESHHTEAARKRLVNFYRNQKRPDKAANYVPVHDSATGR